MAAHDTASTSAAGREPARPAGVDLDIRRDITKAIFDLRLPPGTRLSEATLGELYGVSRTVARKALFQLVSDGMVEMRPNRGAIVATPGVTEVHEVFQARRVVEAALLERSIPAMVLKDYRRLHQLAKADAEALRTGDRGSTIRTSAAFHRELARIAGNAVLQEFLDRLIGRTSLIIATWQPDSPRACSPHDHEKLVALVEQRDIPRAQAALRQHLRDCEADLRLGEAPANPPLARMLGRVAATPDSVVPTP